MNEPWKALRLSETSITTAVRKRMGHAEHDSATILDASNQPLFRMDLGFGRDPTINEDIVRRLVACVNACAGIPTGALEAGLLLEIRDLLTSAYSNVSHGGPTRGELAAILRKAGMIS